MIVEASQLFSATELPEGIRVDGDRRFATLFKTVNKAHQADLDYLRDQAVTSSKTIETTADKDFWTQLTFKYLLALHTKMGLLERVQAYGIPESLLTFCTTKQHDECVQNLLLFSSKNEQPKFVKVLDSFCMSFLDPMSAIDAIISYIIPYPKESRCALITAFSALFGRKIRIRAADISLIIPHVYMLLESEDLLQTIGAQCKTFAEIQSMLTK